MALLVQEPIKSVGELVHRMNMLDLLVVTPWWLLRRNVAAVSHLNRLLLTVLKRDYLRCWRKTEDGVG